MPNTNTKGHLDPPNLPEPNMSIFVPTLVRGNLGFAKEP